MKTCAPSAGGAPEQKTTRSKHFKNRPRRGDEDITYAVYPPLFFCRAITPSLFEQVLCSVQNIHVAR